MAEISRRLTRSQSKQPRPVTDDTFPCSDSEQTTANPKLPRPSLPPPIALPSALLPNNTRLLPHEHALLIRKQSLLRSVDLTAHEIPPIANAVATTLVFAAHQAGTAVCISPNGLLLTASHCIAETLEELEAVRQHPPWLIFSDGRAVCATPLNWDPHRDLVLLQITHSQDALGPFPYTLILSGTMLAQTPLVCIGHPGSEDLEASPSSSGKLKASGYDVLCVTRGRFRGMQAGQDPHDNEEIGALKHDCWTYWGHSGAPLVIDTGKRARSSESDIGRLVGLHSSWDEETGMRRGVGLEAIREFMNTWQAQVEVESSI